MTGERATEQTDTDAPLPMDGPSKYWAVKGPRGQDGSRKVGFLTHPDRKDIFTLTLSGDDYEFVTKPAVRKEWEQDENLRIYNPDVLAKGIVEYSPPTLEQRCPDWDKRAKPFVFG